MDKVLTVVTATEGGAYDAVNMYDRCIVSVGLIQWCEANAFAVSTILGRCMDLDPFMVQTTLKKFPSPVEFKKNGAGLYRFFSKGIEVNSEALQRQLFLGGPAMGFKGVWTPELREYAKQVAAWFASFWDYPLFRTAQAEYTKARMPGFVTTDARKILFSNPKPDDQFGWSGALRAAYYSFAANLPSVASKSLVKASMTPAWLTRHPEGQFYIALQVLTFGPGISIYPKRYEDIAPVLSSLFGVAIPLKADELKQWKEVPEELQVPLSVTEQSTVSRLAQLATWIDEGEPSSLPPSDA